MGSSESKARDSASGQLPLDFEHQPSTTRDDLVISDPLSAAIGIVDIWPEWPSPVVILAGPTGAGKTHLANIWKERAGAVTMSATGDEDKVLRLAEAGPVLIEDIDREGFDETLLFHLINTVRQHGTAMMITTRMWPAAWPVQLPDLRSRLRAATIVEIGEPDDELLEQVIEKLFADRQIVIDPKVVSYLVQRMERSLDAAQTIVQRMDQIALARRAKINRSLAAEVLADLEANGYDADLS
ncbi:DnaA regulatory inactivator HdaA [Hoeflea sp. TYP-13]|uniref:DnaA regulatory inactivator HdaA n=1 Tax=Hoeflea sp. TYP-13 TaxID=3230023 RepID=UPI0034C6D205